LLTEAEKRQLAGIESELPRTAPVFVERLVEGWNRQRGWRKIASQLGTVVAVSMAGLGIVLAQVNLVAPSIAAVAVALIALGFAAFLDR
jgi:hypothetical protein